MRFLKHRFLKHQVQKHQLITPEHQLVKTSTGNNIDSLKHRLRLAKKLSISLTRLFLQWALPLIVITLGPTPSLVSNCLMHF